MSNKSIVSPIVIPGIITTQKHFERWLITCISEEQLNVQRAIVEDFFTQKRFPTETPNAIKLARISLFLTIDERLEDIKKIPSLQKAI